jgi:asparagine synthase (glutamine-hydrolysing)
MCGIAGIFSYKPEGPPVDASVLVRVRDHMRRRGPDGEGLWVSEDRRIGFAHRRLAIIDLSEAGAQPMVSEDGRFCVNFNGEIYNYRELRSTLRQKGYVFRSECDTEVLLHLYAEHGQDMVRYLQGMYAFAIWDAVKGGLFVARDPFGIKPFYYYDDGKTFYFASQVKALVETGAVPTEPEEAGHTGFLLWGFVPEPYTLYRGLLALPAGSTLWVTVQGVQRPREFFDIGQTLAEAEGRAARYSTHEARELLRAALEHSVARHLVADVPVGIFLSAGVDSTTLAAHASRHHSRLRTFTLGFQEYKSTPHDEVSLAESVAKRYATEHTTRWITKAEFRADLDAVLSAMDQPSIDGVNTYFVSKAAAETGMKVALSGVGGDELFGGYPSFRQIPRMVRMISPLPGAASWGTALRMAISPLLKRVTSPKYAGLLEYGGSFGGAYLLRRGLFMPWEIDEVMNPCMVREGLEKLNVVPVLESMVSSVKRPYLRVAALETTWYMRGQLLRDTDWAGMAHSLEVRVPLVDLEFFRTVLPLIVNVQPASKRDLASTPREPLPDGILNRAKTGFSVPVREWITGRGQGESKHRGLRGWALRLHEGVGGRGVTGPPTKPAIVIFRIGTLGDTVVALPAIEHLRKSFPNHRFILLTDRHPGRSAYVSSWDVVKHTGWFDDAIFYNARSTITERLKTLFSLRRLMKRLKPERLISLSPHRSRRQRIRDALIFRGYYI